MAWCCDRSTPPYRHARLGTSWLSEPVDATRRLVQESGSVRADIYSKGGTMTRTLADDTKELLEKTIEDYKAEEPISAGALNSTITGGIAAVLSAVGAGVGSVFAATNGAQASVVVATLAVVAVSILGLLLIVRSDHQSRTAVTLDVIRSIPELISAAHESEAPPAANVSDTGAAALALLNGAHPDGDTQAIPVYLRVVFKGDVGASNVIAVRTSPKLEMLALRPGSGRFDWAPNSDVDHVAV